MRNNVININTIDTIIYSFMIYIGIIFINGIFHIIPSVIGAIVFLLTLFIFHLNKLILIQINRIVIWIFFCVLFSLIPITSMLYDNSMLLNVIHELIKYYALFLVILFGIALPITPLNKSKKSKYLYIFILLFLIIGWLFSKSQGLMHGDRIGGFLANANNFALTAFPLYFLIKSESGKLAIWLITHAIVIFMIYLSQTSGAILGYISGIIYYFMFNKRKILPTVTIFFILVIVLCTLFFYTPSETSIKPLDSTIKKIVILKENYNKVFSGKSIDYYALVQKEKGDYTSALWRLSHWSNILTTYSNSSWTEILFGYGIGSTDVLFGTKSHNDYLRILFEGGILSFILNIAIWGTLYRRMKDENKWVVVAIAAYSFTENNYDNFLVMSMLALYMIGNQKVDEVVPNQIPKTTNFYHAAIGNNPIP